MDCNLFIDNIHLYVSRKGDMDLLREMDDHIKSCNSCKKHVEEVSWFFLSLEKESPALLSKDFTERVLKRTRAMHIQHESLLARLKELIMIYPHRWTVGGLVAVAAVLVITFTFYKGIISELPSNPSQNIKGSNITFYAVKNPILIDAEKSTDIALDDLKKLIRQRQGKILQVLMKDNSFRVTIGISAEREKIMLNDLSRIGKVTLTRKGYKDAQGNIVVILLPKH